MLVADGKQLAFAVGDPELASKAAAFRAVAIAARVVADLGHAAVGAHVSVAAERGGAAAFDGGQGTEVVARYVSPVSVFISIFLDDIRQLVVRLFLDITHRRVRITVRVCLLIPAWRS